MIYSKVVGYKVNRQKSNAFLYTINEQVEMKIKNTVSFTLPPLKMKYLCINLTKYVQDLYEENHKIPMNKMKELNKYWIDIPCS